jgi:hypothetical protein
MTITDRQLAEVLKGLFELAVVRDGAEDLDAVAEEVGTDPMGGNVIRASTFDETGLLTRDEGVVVKFRNGAEFQITVVQSKRARYADADSNPDW